MFGIVDLTTFIIGTIVIVLLPGPNSMYVMTVAARRGVGAGLRGAAGIFVGDLILMILSVAGVASLVQTTPILFSILKYAGGAYLVWLGLGLLRSAWQRGSEVIEVPTDNRHPFKVALTISLLNPKAILFFVSFFIQFVDPSYANPLVSFVILGAIVQLCSQLYLVSLVLIAVYFKTKLAQRSRLTMASKAGAGTLFVGYGMKLALATQG